MSAWETNKSAGIDIECPKCGNKRNELISRLKDNPTLICHDCGHNTIVQADELKALLKIFGG